VAVPLFVLSYVLGCLSPGYLLVRRATGRDLRASHTGSTGARNAGRVAGRGVAAAVFGLDLAKGAAAVAVARLAGLGDAGAAACLFAVVLGHVAPAQLRFRGGRGLSTAVGGLLVLAPQAGLIGIAIATAAVALTRSFTVAGIAAAAGAPLAAWLAGLSGGATAWVAATGGLILLAHARRPAPPSPARPGN
jgi:glycerol-3-phosphate acyltransferase PlsY